MNIIYKCLFISILSIFCLLPAFSQSLYPSPSLTPSATIPQSTEPYTETSNPDPVPPIYSEPYVPTNVFGNPPDNPLGNATDNALSKDDPLCCETLKDEIAKLKSELESLKTKIQQLVQHTCSIECLNGKATKVIAQCNDPNEQCIVSSLFCTKKTYLERYLASSYCTDKAIPQDEEIECFQRCENGNTVEVRAKCIQGSCNVEKCPLWGKHVFTYKCQNARRIKTKQNMFH